MRIIYCYLPLTHLFSKVPHLGLHAAAATGNIGLAKYAISHGQPINSVINGVLPLHAACSGGHGLVVKLLIDNGADVNAPRYVLVHSDFPDLFFPTPTPKWLRFGQPSVLCVYFGWSVFGVSIAPVIPLFLFPLR